MACLFEKKLMWGSRSLVRHRDSLTRLTTLTRDGKDGTEAQGSKSYSFRCVEGISGLPLKTRVRRSRYHQRALGIVEKSSGPPSSFARRVDPMNAEKEMLS